MPKGRQSIPASIDRAVRVEAGHRCAIPTCRAAGILDICHIVPWADCKEHKFENLLALCPNCHRLEQDGKIDRKSMVQYKENLGILNARYGLIEQRIIHEGTEYYEKNGIPEIGSVTHELPGGSQILVKGLLNDGFIYLANTDTGLTSLGGIEVGLPVRELYALSEFGWKLIERTVRAKSID